MCGIAGWFGSGPAPDRAARLAAAIRHRGPDAHSAKAFPSATLVHTRLSILDLSATGHQPMANDDGSVWTVFNGEIYNHHELRHELVGRGHRFRGHSDTEVIPHLLRAVGPGFVSRLRGMFAFATYDSRDDTLLLGRDRFGIKPLFYATGMTDDGPAFAFASEIGALRGFPWVDDEIDRQAVSDFAALTYVPAPATIFRGIRALEPGTSLEVRREGGRLDLRHRTYHEWDITVDDSLDLPTASKRAGGLLQEAVARQLESDVSLGSLLSGGIDSSLVSAAAQAAAERPLLTYNVQFTETAYDETWAAKAVANHIGSSHTTLSITDVAGTWEHVTGLLSAAGQPYADSSLFAANAVCRKMREHVTVALSGDGGDEGFGGYNLFKQLERTERFGFVPPAAWKLGAAAARPLARLGLLAARRPAQLDSLARADLTGVVEGLHRWVPEEEHGLLCRAEGLLPVRRFFERRWDHVLPKRSSALERLSALATEASTRVTMANDFLFKVDTASMRESLEVRVPMLDEDLFGFGLTLPHRLKVSANVPKAVLREVARQELPPKVAEKPKHGFGIPVDQWVDGDFKARLREELTDASCRLPEYFRPEAYMPLIDAFCTSTPMPGQSREGLYQRVTMLLAAHLFVSGRGGAGTL